MAKKTLKIVKENMGFRDTDSVRYCIDLVDENDNKVLSLEGFYILSGNSFHFYEYDCDLFDLFGIEEYDLVCAFENRDDTIEVEIKEAASKPSFIVQKCICKESVNIDECSFDVIDVNTGEIALNFYAYFPYVSESCCFPYQTRIKLIELGIDPEQLSDGLFDLQDNGVFYANSNR